ncbi:ribosomal large subunit pseudouridine synthaseB [Mycoplasmopsis bovigenitalium]|uniref:Ribosomal large subunit pseudouridine synthaseB n=1 Tax=Mycoplasmopsis bovigenitalium TaxID=2112 RepID=A0A449A8F3_9BACT|nr:pseudouridine synthase [Mycoplasmopsis bovigenitalium]VEU60539.1 ribosomal large subunit pseudouridine synthaseB [Mycoplasmopsis bovigenitalium]
MVNERIQKLIAQSGKYSRREAEKLIENGKVRVNGKVAQLGDKATINDAIYVNNKKIDLVNNKLVYYVLNKPKKTITSLKDQFNRQTVVDLVPNDYRVVPVGRLDYNTTGTLILTNDLEIVNKLTHPKYEIPRTYRARIDEPLTLKQFNQLNSGIVVNGKISNQIVDQIENKSYLVTLNVGSYHHVKKLFEALGRKVINLKRVSYANINVETMPEGTYRDLTFKELKDLKNIIRLQEEKLSKK